MKIETFPNLENGSIVHGYVFTDINDALLIRIARGETGRVHFRYVCDYNIERCTFDFEILYPIGSVVRVKIVSHYSGLYALTMSHRDIEGEIEFDDIEVGKEYETVITGFQNGGIFVALLHCFNISALETKLIRYPRACLVWR